MEQVIMNHLNYPILSTVIFLPVLGALLILLTRRSWELLTKGIALATSIATFLLSIPLFTEFDKSTYKMQLRRSTSGSQTGISIISSVLTESAFYLSFSQP
jgi:NADH:ubiquinone oxidoreductase subunit 4 (subunit M)